MKKLDKKRITIRPVADDEREFLLAVYEASRETELGMTAWDAAQKRLFAALQLDAQTMHYRELYPDATHDIVLCDGEPVGRLYINRDEDQIAILDITVLPEHRKKGIATSLVKDLQKEAKRTNRFVRIYIESFNPSQQLFRELGFEVAAEEGVNLLFKWRGQKI